MKRLDMRKVFLLVLVSVFIGLSGKAQFWKRVQQVRVPLIERVDVNKSLNFTLNTPVKLSKITPVTFGRTRYNYDLEEAAIMKDLYHTLRFRMYPDAIASLKQLVGVYIEESRYSEAKWYLLQCIYFGKKSNNNFAVVNAMVALGLLKADIGEYDQARQDLLDAKDICKTQSMTGQLADIDKKLKVVEAKRFANVKNEVQYAEVFENKKG